MEALELVITRSFDAHREQVWRAWTVPAQMMRWWGPGDFTAPFCSIDLRVGGRYLACMRSAEGQDYWSTGVYRELVEPERIVYTDGFADAQGNVVPASYYGMEEFPVEQVVTITLEAEFGKTKMTLRHSDMPSGTMRKMCDAGWNQSFDKLAASLAKGESQ